MPQCPISDVAPLLPHSGKMVLLDEVLSYDEHSLHARTVLRADNPLLEQGAQSLASYMALEIMAQGIGAWAGAHALDIGEPVRLGFLLGTRKLVWQQEYIPVGSVLDIRIVQSWHDAQGMGVFDCTLEFMDSNGENSVISAALNVFSPTSEEALQSVMM